MKSKIKLILLVITLSTNLFAFDMFGLFKKDPRLPYKPLVTKQMYLKDMLCKERVFKCLPEYKDMSSWNIPVPDGVDDIIWNKKTHKKYNKINKQRNDNYDLSYSKYKNDDNLWYEAHKEFYTKSSNRSKRMYVTQINEDFIQAYRKKEFLVDMEKVIEEDFPGFWKDVPKKVRYRWINIANTKGKKFGHKKTRNQPLIELCARIGLYFDKDDKWSDIVKFIKQEDGSRKAAYTNAYLDFTLFDKTHSKGTLITDWLLRGAFPALPKPNKPIPKLND